MKTKARLAASEFDKTACLSIRRSIGFPGSTLHGHDFYELDIITGESARSALNGKAVTAERGAVFFLTPADFHEYSFEGGFDLYNIQFTVDAVSPTVLSLLTESDKRAFFPSAERFERILSYTELLYSVSGSGKTNGEIAARLIECILLTLKEELSGESERRSATASLGAAISFIHAHFKENPKLSEVAEKLSVSEKHFCRLFKEYTGQTYKEYLRGVKLRYARRLVIATDFSVTEISEVCGYSTQTHFNREFKEYYGVSPLKMRKNPDGL